MEPNVVHFRGTMDGGNKLNDTDPNLSVHIPIIPHSGIKIVTTLVTTNCAIDSQIYDYLEIDAAYHLLRANLPISLDVPEGESTDSRGNSL
jgi:hypothetical protein